MSAKLFLVISNQKLPVEKWESEVFLLLPFNFLGAP
jgi:hypothetical protein